MASIDDVTRRASNWVLELGVDPTTAANRAFANGLSFHLAAQRSCEERPLKSGNIQLLIVPSLVSFAFASECYLKGLHVLAHSKPTSGGHSLTDLFRKLPTAMQTMAEQRYQNLASSTSSLSIALDECSSVFVKWRYVFEKAHLTANIDALRHATTALLLTALDHGASVAEESLSSVLAA